MVFETRIVPAIARQLRDQGPESECYELANLVRRVGRLKRSIRNGVYPITS